ncbi:hypothetical protein ACA910_007242 [Epithemia clementina (nom. ined.)]
MGNDADKEVDNQYVVHYGAPIAMLSSPITTTREASCLEPPAATNQRQVEKDEKPTHSSERGKKRQKGLFCTVLPAGRTAPAVKSKSTERTTTTTSPRTQENTVSISGEDGALQSPQHGGNLLNQNPKQKQETASKSGVGSTTGAKEPGAVALSRTTTKTAFLVAVPQSKDEGIKKANKAIPQQINNKNKDTTAQTSLAAEPQKPPLNVISRKAVFVTPPHGRTPPPNGDRVNEDTVAAPTTIASTTVADGEIEGASLFDRDAFIEQKSLQFVQNNENQNDEDGDDRDFSILPPSLPRLSPSTTETVISMFENQLFQMPGDQDRDVAAMSTNDEDLVPDQELDEGRSMWEHCVVGEQHEVDDETPNPHLSEILISATLVQDVSNRGMNGGEIIEAHPLDKDEQPSQYRKRNVLIITACVCVLLFTVVVAVAFTVPSSPVPAPATQRVSPPIQNKSVSLIQTMLASNYALLGGDEFDDEDTNSYWMQALRFVETRSTPGMPDWRIGQRYALACIYFATTGRVTEDGILVEWKNHWTSSSNECTWYGVICQPVLEDDNGLYGNVTRIYLEGNSLRGIFPPEVVILNQTLLDLRLLNNSLSFSNWSDYRWLGGLLNLQFLDLSDTLFGENEVQGLPLQFGNLVKLKKLRLVNIPLSGPLNDVIFAGMMDLEVLILQDVSFNGSSLPTTLQALPKLSEVHFRNNTFAGGLDNLFVRDDENRHVFPSIKTLDIVGNPGIGGTMPSSIGLLTTLETLSLTDSGLTGHIPPEMAFLKSNLRKLDMADNNFMGDLDALFGSNDSAGGFSKLWLLSFQNNFQISGTIPTTIGLFTSLQWMDFRECKLSGTISTEFGILSNLRSFLIQGTFMNGTIPREIGNMTSLNHLLLANNSWTGTIPSELGMLSSLTHLYLEDNILSGTIPLAISQMTSLYYVQLSGNHLTGSIPTELGGSLSNLRTLYLQGNFLNDTIPVSLSELKSLVELMLDDNDLTGSMPSEICQLRASLSLLSADCKADDPEVMCAATCCTCCESPC